MVGSWRDSSIDKAESVQALGTEFRLSHLRKKASTALSACKPTARELVRMDPWFLWPARLVELVNMRSGSVRDAGSKPEVESD